MLLMKSILIFFFFQYFLFFNLSAQETAKLPPAYQQVLDHHNKIRKLVRVPPLQYSASLSAYAQQWAEHLASRGSRIYHSDCMHPDGRSLGENIFGEAAPMLTLRLMPQEAGMKRSSSIASDRYRMFRMVPVITLRWYGKIHGRWALALPTRKKEVSSL